MPGRHRTRTPFSVGSQRHELGRLDIQETNKAPSQTGIRNQEQANTHKAAEEKRERNSETISVMRLKNSACHLVVFLPLKTNYMHELGEAASSAEISSSILRSSYVVKETAASRLSAFYGSNREQLFFLLCCKCWFYFPGGQ